MLKLLFRWLGATEVQAGYYMTRTFDSKQQEGLRPPGQKSTETHVWQTPASTITPAWVASVRATASGTARHFIKAEGQSSDGGQDLSSQGQPGLFRPTNSQTSTCLCRGCSLPLPLPQADHYSLLSGADCSLVSHITTHVSQGHSHHISLMILCVCMASSSHSHINLLGSCIMLADLCC